jgi:arylsulfatase A-like enzyme
MVHDDRANSCLLLLLSSVIHEEKVLGRLCNTRCQRAGFETGFSETKTGLRRGYSELMEAVELKERNGKRLPELRKVCGAGSGPGTARKTRSWVLFGILACLATFLAVGCSGSEAAESSESTQQAQASTTRPNIIFILTDDLDFASVQRMPTLRSQLIDKGTSFEKTFISYPLCCPSRSTILTGLYVHNHGVKGNQPPNGGFEKFRDEGYEENSIAARLQQNGYTTGLFGKYLNHYTQADPEHVPPGWDQWYGKLDEQKLYNYRINENGEVVSYGNSTEDFFTDVLSKKATDFVHRAASDATKPFFMYLAPTAPHGPATPAERHKDAFADETAPRPPSFDEEDVSDKPSYVRDIDRISDDQASNIDERYRNRLGSMLAVDEMVDSLIRELEADGALDNTFIFFTSDNGFHQGEHRIKQGKRTPYEESAHVPLFVRGPGVPAGSEVEKLVVNTDFAPTFADLAGMSFPADGRSLKPLLLGDDPSWRSAILLEGFTNQGEGQQAGGKTGKGKGKGKAKGDQSGLPAYEAIRTETRKYVEYDNGDRELYDLQADPYELNSAPESIDPSVTEEDLKTRLDALSSCAGDGGCQKAEDAS